MAAILIPLIAYMWPMMQDQIAMFADLIDSPVYQAILGQLGLIGLGSFEGAIYMYIFSWLEMLMVIISNLKTSWQVSGLALEPHGRAVKP